MSTSAQGPLAASRADGPTPPVAGEQLRELAAGVFHALRQAPRDGDGLPPRPGRLLLDNLQAELGRRLEDAVQDLVSDLREELPTWLAALEHLERLADCRYLPSREAASALQQDLQAALAQAVLFTQTLEVAPLRAVLPFPRPDAPALLQRPEAPAPPAEARPGLPLESCLSAPPPSMREEPSLDSTPPPRPSPIEGEGERTPRPSSIQGEREIHQGHNRERPPARPAANAPEVPGGGACPPRAEPSEAPAAAPAPGTTAPKQPARREPPAETLIRVACPDCGAAGAVRWDRLGRVLACKGCERHYRVTAEGQVVPVTRTADGRWVESASLRPRRRLPRLNRWAVSAASLLAVVLAGGAWLLPRPEAAAAPDELPQGLEARAELLGKAWLAKDLPLMRRLTLATHERAVYSWLVRHPAPASRPDGLRLEVQPRRKADHSADVVVRIQGLPSEGKRGAFEFPQHWEERDGIWFFVPPAR